MQLFPIIIIICMIPLTNYRSGYTTRAMPNFILTVRNFNVKCYNPTNYSHEMHCFLCDYPFSKGVIVN